MLATKRKHISFRRFSNQVIIFNNKKNFRDISLDTPIDYMIIYNSFLSFKKLCEVNDENFIFNLILRDEKKFFDKILK